MRQGEWEEVKGYLLERINKFNTDLADGSISLENLNSSISELQAKLKRIEGAKIALAQVLRDLEPKPNQQGA